MGGKKSRAGFTIIELLIFVAIYVTAIVGFIVIFTSFLSVQTRQYAETEVNQQSQYLLTMLQQQIDAASIVDMAADTATGTLTLRMASSANDPVLIYASSGIAYQKLGAAGPQPLTSSKVNVTALVFTRRINSGGRDTVQISYTIQSAQGSSRFARSISTAMQKSSVAVFDADLNPSVGTTYKLGAANSRFKSINDAIYFWGGKVGIGSRYPAAQLEVNGGMRLNTAIGEPSCVAGTAGTLWHKQGGSGVKDTVELCVKSSTATYFWFPVY
jgi:hypothetical protein